MQDEKKLSEKESLELITDMIKRAKDSYHTTGIDSIMWGCVIAVCSLVKLAEIQFSFHLPFDIYLLTLIAIIPQVFIAIKEKRQKRVISYDDAFLNYLWLGFGICIFLLILIDNNVFATMSTLADSQKLTGHRDWTDFKFAEFVSSLFLLLYGLPTFVTGAACKFTPMLLGGLLCWASSVAAIYTPIKIDLLLTAVSAVFAWLVPGIIMERDYQKAKRELAVANV